MTGSGVEAVGHLGPAEKAAQWTLTAASITHAVRHGNGIPEEAVTCPECAATDNLLLQGAWGRPARLSCGNGHHWHGPLDHEGDADLLRRAIVAAVDARLHEARPDCGRHIGVQMSTLAHAVTADAERDIAAGRWQLTVGERSSFAVLCPRLRRPYTPEALDTTDTAAARLTSLHGALIAIVDATTGRNTRTGRRLDAVLLDTAAALRPALQLTPGDLEQADDGGRRAMADLDRAEWALVQTRVVLLAAVVGDLTHRPPSR